MVKSKKPKQKKKIKNNSLDDAIPHADFRCAGFLLPKIVRKQDLLPELWEVSVFAGQVILFFELSGYTKKKN